MRADGGAEPGAKRQGAGRAFRVAPVPRRTELVGFLLDGAAPMLSVPQSLRGGGSWGGRGSGPSRGRGVSTRPCRATGGASRPTVLFRCAPLPILVGTPAPPAPNFAETCRPLRPERAVFAFSLWRLSDGPAGAVVAGALNPRGSSRADRVWRRWPPPVAGPSSSPCRPSALWPLPDLP